MTSLRTLRLLALAGLGPVLTGQALAQDGRYYYGGLSIGQSRGKLDTENIGSSLLGPGQSLAGTSRDEHDTAYKIFGGYQMSRHLGLELGYFRLGRFGFNSTTLPAGTLDGRVRVQGVNLDLVGTLPLGESWAALARVGAQYARTRSSFATSGAATVSDADPSKRETNYKVGVGLQYAFSPSVLMRGEVERYRVGDAVNSHMGVNVYSLSLVFPFGRAEAPRMAAAPIYVAPTPPPPPAPAIEAPAPPPVVAVAAAPAPVPLRRVRFSAESLFGFDKSAVKPEGMAALDQFARELDGTTFERVNVEGHTDRLGTPGYNQTLSLQRADAVKAYLVSAGHVDPARIGTVGKGESAPVTKPEDCKGSRPGAALIACLQPDRRVEIEVTGTR